MSSYLMSQMMWKKDYPLDHVPTEEKLKKLKRKRDYQELTFEEYQDFLMDGEIKSSLLINYELWEDDFQTRGQFLNWIIEKRLKDGRII